MMLREEELKVRKRESRLLSDTLKDTQNHLNFRFMERYRS